ncbi:Ig-like domain-containing protein [Nocardia sp. NPDC057227]|uniref:Ig-like domain-containing protein n=1 Tax=Nocardia sp. NPDC057227 TaxID=3346056 RepID=UPI00362E964F
MPNVFEKPTRVVDTAIGLLLREIVLPRIVWTNGIGDFAGTLNDSVTIRIPARTKARRRELRATGSARNIQLDNLTETKIAVELTDDVYNAVPVTDEELTLDIVNFGKQILVPQVRAVVEGLEDDIAKMIQSAPYQTTIHVGTGDGATWEAYVKARKTLNTSDVDMGERTLVGGAAWEAALLTDPQFVRYDHTGDSNNTALREAKIGRIGNTEFVTSNALREGEAYLYHKSAFIFANRAPLVPKGAVYGATRTEAGLSLRAIQDYDAMTSTDRSIVNSYAGYKAVEDPEEGFVRGVRLLLTVTFIEVKPGAATIAAAATQQLKVFDSNGFDVTASCTFTSSATSKATVNSSGLVTGVAAGTSTITATYQPVTGGSTVTDTCAITVTA